jgi:hypothetical protein
MCPMIRPTLPIFKGGTKRGRNALKTLGGAGKMAARGAQAWNARSFLYGPLRVAGAGDTQAHSALGPKAERFGFQVDR